MLHGYWSIYAQKDEKFKEAISETLRTLGQTDAKIIFLAGVPVHEINVPKGVALNLWKGSDYRSSLSKPEDIPPGDGLGESLNVAEELGIQILDPKTSFLSSDGKHFDVSKNQIVLYHDSQHLSDTGSKLMIKPLLEKSVEW